MILRLTLVTSLLALFALSFSALVEHDGRNAYAGPRAAGQAGHCFDQGAVCAPRVN